MSNAQVKHEMKRRTISFIVQVLLATNYLLAQQVATQAPQQAPSPRTGNANSSQQLLSEKLNEQLPRWLRIGGDYRARFEGITGGNFRANSDDAYLLSRLRINLFLIPTNWLKFGFQGQDSHVFWKNQAPPAPPFQDAMDVRQAYVELGDTEKKPVGLRIGRQELAYGDERLVGNSNWLNTARSFDALRGTYRRQGYRLDLFAARVVKLQNGEFDWSTPGTNFYGAYGGLEKLVPGSTIEPYFFWRRSAGLATETGTIGILNFATVGTRWVGKLPHNFDYGLEMDRQDGSLGTDSIGAWAGHWVVGKAFAKRRFKPRIFTEYNYASGDHNPRDGHRTTFDHLYPTGHDKYGLVDQVGWKNIRNARAGADFRLNPKYTLVCRYDAWWLADTHDALYNAAGTVVARVANGTGGRFVGQEFDTVLSYNLSRQLQISGGYGHIFPGTFLNHATPGKSYNFPYASTVFVF